jgi:purine-nucleoside phosphorylase
VTDPYALAADAADRLAALTGRNDHRALVVLGSGWGPAADAFGEPDAVVAMTEVPGFRAPVAEGHLGEIRSYVLGGVPTLVYLGRTHLYEGHGLEPVVHGIRTAAAAGVRTAVLTNANGSLRADWELGRPVLVADHLTMTATSPLAGPRFTDLTDAWSPRLRDLARRLDPSLAEGVYAWLRGPHYETWAEAEWLRRLGADVLGMSTVPEAVAAREAGIEVVGLSTVTAVEGVASGIDPAEVVAVAERTAAAYGPLLGRLVAEGAG